MPLVMTAATLARQQGLDLETGSEAPVLSPRQFSSRRTYRC